LHNTVISLRTLNQSKLAFLPGSGRGKGFTLVELVIVIVLVSIVAVTAVSRYLTPSAFDAAGVRDGLITTLRAAQQAALGRSNVAATIQGVGDKWVFTANANGSVLQTMDVNSRNMVLATGSALVGAGTCAAALDTPLANDFRLRYDSQGNLSEFVNGGVTQTVTSAFNGVRVCVNDTAQYSVCVSPSGYAYVGDCDD
jgi:MSHA pilin protein MshC